jgi:aspartyl-tRNA(Asn)/glutamyl-tRNA(Gln) amidotransferase subunit A
MTESELENLTIAESSSRIKCGELSPVALTDLFLQRIARLNPSVNAYTTVLADSAKAEAKIAEQEIRSGNYRSPLHGIPISIKDNLATIGVPTTGGSKILADWKPDFDATVVVKLKATGVITLGKTNMHEWALGGTTINPFFGTTHNPWDLTRVPGGSSGGSAAAVAAAMCLASIGTDSAGSVRNPAAMCGIVGLKPTYGRVSCFGGVPGTGAYSTNHFGVLTRTVKDCALVLQEIAGYDPKDPLSAAEPTDIYSAKIGQEIGHLKAGLIGSYYDKLMFGKVEQIFAAALRQLELLGMKTEQLSIPHMDLTPAVHTVVSRAEIVSDHDHYLRTRARDYSPELLYRHIQALMFPAGSYVTAQRVRRLIAEEFERAFERVDVIVTPVSIPAPKIEECGRGVTDVDGEKVSLRDARGSTWGLSTVPFNVTGHPAISVCCGFTGAGQPVGLQIVGRPFEESTVLQVAGRYEQAAGWYQRKPQLAGIGLGQQPRAG